VFRLLITIFPNLQAKYPMSTLSTEAYSYPQNTDSGLPVIGDYMSRQLPILKSFSQNSETLLIHGPTGAGKSKLALWCHQQSKRHDQPFEVVDLASIPQEMKMAALFGWQKGAFTGASQANQGAVGRAQNGTLFIDEIDKLSLEAQAGLLQLLDTGKYRSLGDDRTLRQTNIRFIIGTNVNLLTHVTQGLFREDLYYRINILPIKLPPLVERQDEIEHWANYMLERCTLQNGVNIASHFTAKAKELLQQQYWPGNLRQLDNIVRRSFALSHTFNSHQPFMSVDISHVKKALAMDPILSEATSANHNEQNAPHQNPSTLSSGLWQCAAQFVDLAMAKQQHNQPLNLDETQTFKGYVLTIALQRLADKKRVYQLFGKDKAIANRTYQREIKRELQKTADFESTLNLD
jgi:DNA-binding NtrC family response regulator